MLQLFRRIKNFCQPCFELKYFVQGTRNFSNQILMKCWNLFQLKANISNQFRLTSLWKNDFPMSEYFRLKGNKMFFLFIFGYSRCRETRGKSTENQLCELVFFQPPKDDSNRFTMENRQAHNFHSTDAQKRLVENSFERNLFWVC